ncbi:MAG: GTP-binding protein Era [Myxococcota bacterium]|jgi:GTP-binding protein Era
MSLIPRAEVTTRWEAANSEISQALSQRLVIAFLGSASAGKDAGIRALFGIDFGQIDPIPGSTDRIRVAPMDSDGKVLVVNAPGFGDIRADVDATARDVIASLDLCVYVLNCDGGATIDERRDLDAIRELGRPVLVCLNKIDLIRPHQREAFIAATLIQLGVARDMAVVTAFDPLAVLSATPIGIDEVISWIHKTLEKQGKALLFAKQLRNKAAACEPIIHSAAKKAAVAGSIPIPGADMAAVTAIQVRMISDIAAVFGARIDQDVILFIIGEALAGSSKGFVRWAISALKTAGWIPGGQIAELAVSAIGSMVASAATYGVGRASVVFIQRGQGLSGGELQEIFDMEALKYRAALMDRSKDASANE